MTDPTSPLIDALRNLSRPQYDGLTTWDLIPLSFETQSAVNLLIHGHSVLLQHRPVDASIDVLSVVISIGMEKLLKVALGHALLKDSSGWTIKTGGYGHRVHDMNRSLLRIAEKSELNTERTARLIADLREDNVIQALLATMQQYATGGRFRYLDELEKKHGLSPGEGPFGAWVTLLLVVSDDHPDFEPDEDLDLHHRALAEALRRWWWTISELAAAGTLGQRAVSWAEDIRPPDPEPRK